MTRKPSDISVTIAIDHASDGAVSIEIKVAEGNEGPRADVVSLILAQLDALWIELADRVAVERQDIRRRA
jgi:hypothetical protein